MHHAYPRLAPCKYFELTDCTLSFFIFNVVQIVPCQLILQGGLISHYLEFTLQILKLRKKVMNVSRGSFTTVAFVCVVLQCPCYLF